MHPVGTDPGCASRSAFLLHRVPPICLDPPNPPPHPHSIPNTHTHTRTPPYCPSPSENVTCLTRLDHNRALGQLSERSGVHNTKVKNVIIWGNHSSTQYPDVNHATIDGKPARKASVGGWGVGDGVEGRRPRRTPPARRACRAAC